MTLPTDYANETVSLDTHPDAHNDTNTAVNLLDGRVGTLEGTDTATQAELDAHAADTTAVHGIADTTALVLTGDARLTNARTPTAHKVTHQSGGSDELALDAGQVTTGTFVAARIPAIATDSVTNTMLAPMAALTVKGNATASTAGPTDLTVAAARSMLASGAGAFFGFNFDTSTSSSPAAQRLRLNNATPASATVVYVSYTSKDGVDLWARLIAGTAGDRLFIQDRANSGNYRVYELTGAPGDNVTYATCNVVHRGGSGTLWANLTEIVAGFTSPPLTVGTSAPASPLTNDLWIDTT